MSALLCSTTFVLAADYNWTNAGGGNWNLVSNWSGGVVPLASDDATLGTLVNPYTVSLTDTHSINNLTVNYSGVTLNHTGTLTVGGAFNLTAGTYNLNGTLVNNGTMTSAAGTSVTWSGGTIGGNGTTTLNGSALFTGANLNVLGDATLVVGGTTTLGNGAAVYLDENAAGGRLRVSGTLVSSSGSAAVAGLNNGGALGRFDLLAGGTLRQAGGGALNLANDALFDFAGGSTLDAVDAASVISLSNGGTGNSLFRVNGTVATAGAGAVRLAGGVMLPAGNATLSGDAFQWAGGVVGGAADTSLTLSGHALFTGANLNVLGDATLVVGGTTTLGNGAAVYLDENAAGGRLRVSGTLVSSSGSAAVAGLNNGGALGRFDLLAGGTLRQAGGGALNLFGDVNFDIVGTVEAQTGTVSISAASNLLSHSGTTLTKGIWKASNGTLDFNGRTVQTLGTNATVELSGASASFTAMNSLTQNNGTLRVLGGHTFTPAAASINNAGLIEVGTASTFAKGIVVQNNGTLRGSGAVTGNVTAQSGGTVAPGTPATTGDLTVTGNLALQSGSMLNVKLNGTTAGTQHDRLTVNGTVDLGNSTLLGNVGYSAAAGDKLFILVNDGTDPITGTFNGLPNGSQVTIGGYFANLSYFGDSLTLATTGGNDVVLYNFTPVPEPGSILLVTAVPALLGVIRRHVQRSRVLGRQSS
jgi:hypothetical protein